MDQDEKLKFVYEQIVTSSRFFLDWRHKLLGGYIVIISALYYFILTWMSLPEHFTVFIYVLSCLVGILLSILFFLLNHRNNEIIWTYQNNGYMYEKKLGLIDFESDKPVHGLFGAIIKSEIKDRIDTEKKPDIELKAIDKPKLLNLRTHIGAINWFFILVIISFIILLFRTCSLKEEKRNWQAQQKIQIISTSYNK